MINYKIYAKRYTLYYRLSHLTSCAIIIFGMILNIFSNKSRKSKRLTIEDYKNQILHGVARTQFEKLVKKGLRIPIALL